MLLGLVFKDLNYIHLIKKNQKKNNNNNKQSKRTSTTTTAAKDTNSLGNSSDLYKLK